MQEVTPCDETYGGLVSVRRAAGRLSSEFELAAGESVMVTGITGPVGVGVVGG